MAVTALIVTSLGGAAFAATGDLQSGDAEPQIMATSQDPAVEDEAVAKEVIPEVEDPESTETEEATETQDEAPGAVVPETGEGEAPAEEPGDGGEPQFEIEGSVEAESSDEGDQKEDGPQSGQPEFPDTGGAVAYRAPTVLENRALLPPIVVFEEDFQNGTTAAQTLLTGMGGTAGQYKNSTNGMTYTVGTGDKYWAYPYRCNGMVLSYNNKGSNGITNQDSSGRAYCNGYIQTYAILRSQARLLGELNGNGDANRALTELSAGWKSSNAAAWVDDGRIGTTSQGNVGMPLTQFRMNSTVEVKVPTHEVPQAQNHRFLSARLNVAATSCPWDESKFYAPLFGFSLFDSSGNEQSLFGSGYLDGCTDARLAHKTIKFPTDVDPNRNISAAYGTLTTGEAIKWAPANPNSSTLPNVGLVLRNNQAQTNGNDSSIDQIGIIDVTPTLTAKFQNARIKYGQATNLVITVHSRSDVSEKNGWEFTDALPTGLKVAGTPTVSVAGAATVSAPLNGQSITVTNGRLAQGREEITITVPVTNADTPPDCPPERTFQNVAANFKTGDNWNMKYVDFVEGDSLTFYGTGELSWTKTNSVTGALVPGATFSVTGPSHPTGLTVTSTDGNFKAEDLEYGNYTIIETIVPGGFEKPAGSQPVEMTLAAGACKKDFVVKNDPMPRLTLVKIADNPEGAESSAGYLAPEDWTLSAAGPGQSLSGASGATTVTSVVVPAGNYSLGESSTAASQGAYDLTGLSCVNKTSANGEFGQFTEPTFSESSGVVTPGSVTLQAGNDVTCTFTNTPEPGSVEWTKVDDSTPARPLAGSEWKLEGPGLPEAGLSVSVAACPASAPTLVDGPYCVVDGNSFAVGGLAWGGYTLTETKAPVGYVLDVTPHQFTVAHDDLDIEFNGIVNERTEGPALPASGGQSAAMFTIFGLVLAGGAGGAVAYATKRRASRA